MRVIVLACVMLLARLMALVRVMVLACDGWGRGSHGVREGQSQGGPKGRQLEVDF